MKVKAEMMQSPAIARHSDFTRSKAMVPSAKPKKKRRLNLQQIRSQQKQMVQTRNTSRKHRNTRPALSKSKSLLRPSAISNYVNASSPQELVILLCFVESFVVVRTVHSFTVLVPAFLSLPCNISYVSLLLGCWLGARKFYGGTVSRVRTHGYGIRQNLSYRTP